MSFYRIQDRSIPTVQLLDPEFQTSESYCTGTVRAGVSVCGSVEELATYFAQTGIPFDPRTAVMVEVKGYYADEKDEDDALGALLIIPTEIVAVTEIPDEFHATIDSIYA